MRKRRPSVIWSCTKSRPTLVRPERQRHRRANPNGALATAASPHHQPLFFVQPVNPLAVDRVTLAPQQHPKAPIAKPPALPSQRSQPLAQLIVIAPSVPVAHARPVHGSHTARPPLAHREPASQMSHRLAASSGRHHFFPSRSFNAALSSIASANSRFSLAFSASKARSRFASLTSSPPYLLFHV